MRSCPLETSDTYVSLRCWSYLQLNALTSKTIKSKYCLDLFEQFHHVCSKAMSRQILQTLSFQIVLAAQVGQAGAASGERIPGIFALSAFSNKQLVGCFQESETLSSSFKNSGRERSNQSRSSRKR